MELISFAAAGIVIGAVTICHSVEIYLIKRRLDLLDERSRYLVDELAGRRSGGMHLEVGVE